MPAPHVNTYDRLFDETEEAWAAFYRYRDLPNPRPAMDAFAISIGCAPTRLKTFATRYYWPSRLTAWDQRVDSVRQGATLRGVEEMAQRHIKLAMRAQEAVSKALEKIHADLDTDFGRMKGHEMNQLLNISTKLERLSRGEATERVEGAPDYSKLTNEDLAALEEISRRL